MRWRERWLGVGVDEGWTLISSIFAIYLYLRDDGASSFIRGPWYAGKASSWDITTGYDGMGTG